MAKILLGCLIGAIPRQGIRACRAILDFIYLAQYSSHDDESLKFMEKALMDWHTNKTYFLETGVREDFNIPKFHSLQHYVDSIRYFGTTDNYNTEMFERLHIDFAKKGWRASNHRNAFPQMMTWLSRQEKISSFENYLSYSLDQKNSEQGRNSDSEDRMDVDVDIPVPQNRVDSHTPGITIAKFSPSPNKLIKAIEQTHCAPNFSFYLKEFLNRHLEPEHRTSIRRAQDYLIPFERLDIFHQFKFILPAENENNVNDTVKAIPRSKDNPAGRFDTIIFLNSPDAESIQLTGRYTTINVRCTLY